MIEFPRDLPLVHGPGLTDELAAWAAARIEFAQHGFPDSWAVGVVRRRRLAAVVVYHQYNPVIGTVCVSCAADTPGWATRRVIGWILRAGFDGLGEPMRKIWTVPASTNVRSLRFNAGLGNATQGFKRKGVGFVREAVLRHHYAPDVHGVFLGMMRREFESRYGDLFR